MNPARAALTRVNNRLIAEGAPIIREIPAPHVVAQNRKEGRAIRRRAKAAALKRLGAYAPTHAPHHMRPRKLASKADLVKALSAYPGFTGLVRHGGSIDDVFVDLYAAEWSRAWNRPIEEFFELFGRNLCAETLEPELL